MKMQIGYLDKYKIKLRYRMPTTIYDSFIITQRIQNKTIADLSGNVGGDTIRFGINFKEVDSYELNPINFEALKNNVEIYDLKNVHLHLGDATKLFKKKVDMIRN